LFALAYQAKQNAKEVILRLKEFNILGKCYPDEHYMVDISGNLSKMKNLVDQKKYFTIARPRQFGKSTTIDRLRLFLDEDYLVFSVSLEGKAEIVYNDEQRFCFAIYDILTSDLIYRQGLDEIKAFLNRPKDLTLDQMRHEFEELCMLSKKPIVLIIDEVDQASDSGIFISFLGMLRSMYLNRRILPTFRSVILASVYDIRNLKLKIRPDSKEKNSQDAGASSSRSERPAPWNIAVDPEVDMAFSAEEISTMISDYDQERGLGIDVHHVSELIFQLTSGYPYLVSRMCQLADKAMVGSRKPANEAWSSEGLYEVAKAIAEEKNDLFESLDSKLLLYPDLREIIQDIIFDCKVAVDPSYEPWKVGHMLGFLKNSGGNIALFNLILEARYANSYLAKKRSNQKLSSFDKSVFVNGGVLDMDLVIEKFAEYYTDYFSEKTQEYLEKECMIDFLFFLRPIINGGGMLFIETEIRNRKRLDIVVYFNNRLYVIELKKWYGQKYLESGERQLGDYLDYYKLDKGYLITFSFVKSKKIGVTAKVIDGKTIVEAIV
jgi:hypothetical protein